MNEEIFDDEVVIDEPEHLEPVFNHYFDDTKPHHPYTFTGEANPNTLPPNNAVRVAPEVIEGKWPCMKDGVWAQVLDKRGIRIWNTESQEPKDSDEVVIPDGWTDKEPPTRLHRWTTKGWTITKANQAILDEEATQQERAVKDAMVKQLLAEATERIELIESGIEYSLYETDGAMAGAAERLKQWKIYKFRLKQYQLGEAAAMPLRP